MSIDAQERERMKALIDQVRDRLKVTKVVCTRSIKGRGGDTYVGFSAAWNSRQDDGGAGLVHAGESEESPEVQGMTLKEARVAAHLLGLEVDSTAFEHALAGSMINQNQCREAIRGLKHNYGQLMAQLLSSGKPSSNGSE